MTAKRKPIRWAEQHHPDAETRNIDGYAEGKSEMGKSTLVLRCPFCERRVEAFKWSLAGGGKRCLCTALIGWRGAAIQWRES